jgi:hypothetical protein
MMRDPLFDGPGRFWRGNIHGHSSRSDGALPPEEVCRRYRAQGYDFVAITDHLVGMWDYPITDTTGCRGDGFTTLMGAELHSGRQENGAIWHLLAIGLPAGFAPSASPDFEPTAGQETGPQIARRAREAGAYVAIAHPHWSGLTAADMRSIDAAHAVEVYNHGCAMGADRGDGFHAFETLLAEGRRIDLCAADDSHFNDFDGFGGWVMVRAPENAPDALLEALKAGRYYSSQGPEIHAVQWLDGEVEVETSAASRVIVQGAGITSAVAVGDAMTRTRLDLGRLAASPWMRITVADAAGRRAWTNPVWRD